jgi:hypothetical protein
MTGVEGLVTWLESRPRGHVPARVETRELDRVSRFHGQDRLEIAREVTVERASLERNLVVGH